MVRGRWKRGSVTVAAATVLLLGLGVGSAGAHTELVETLPEDGATVAGTLDDVVLVFDHPITFAAVQVTDPEGAAVGTRVETGLTTRLAEPHREFQQVDGEWQEVVSDVGHVARVLPDSWPSAGRYEIAYQYTAEDGHSDQGTVAFTYRGPTGAVTAAGRWQDYDPEPTPVPTPQTGADGTLSRAATEPGGDADGGPAAAVVGVATGSAVALAAGAVLVSRRRAPSHRERGPRPAARPPRKRLF